MAIDPSGKAKGRGAYLCRNVACWEQAIKRNALSRALKTPLAEETIERLREYATELERDV